VGKGEAVFGLSLFCSLFARCLKKMRIKAKINVCRFAYNKINAYLCNVIKKQT
jgi:hypothetical protein